MKTVKMTHYAAAKLVFRINNDLSLDYPGWTKQVVTLAWNPEAELMSVSGANGSLLCLQKLIHYSEIEEDVYYFETSDMTYYFEILDDIEVVGKTDTTTKINGKIEAIITKNLKVVTGALTGARVDVTWDSDMIYKITTLDGKVLRFGRLTKEPIVQSDVYVLSTKYTNYYISI